MENYEELDLNEEENKALLKLPVSTFIWYDSSNQQICLPRKFLTIKDDVFNLDVRPDDVWVTSYAKSGTTWTQEMVWCIMNNLDFQTAKSVVLHERFPFFEREMLGPETVDNLSNTESLIKRIEKSKSPRFIKSHLPWNLLPHQIQNGTVKPKVQNNIFKNFYPTKGLN